MSRRSRRIALALVVVASMLAVATGSGAFSSVTAERTVSVNVAGDADALLGLSVHDGPNGAYAQLSNGQLQILVDGTTTTGSGVNPNARTVIRGVFNVTNQGTQPVDVWIEKSGNYSDLVAFENASSVRLDNTSAQAESIDVGETTEVGLVIDTRGESLSPGETLLDSITIHANATDS